MNAYTHLDKQDIRLASSRPAQLCKHGPCSETGNAHVGDAIAAEEDGRPWLEFSVYPQCLALVVAEPGFRMSEHDFELAVWLDVDAICDDLHTRGVFWPQQILKNRSNDGDHATAAQVQKVRSGNKSKGFPLTRKQ